MPCDHISPEMKRDPLLNHIQKELLESYESVTNDFTRQIAKIEEDTLKAIIFQITGKDATIEDAKKLTKVYRQGEPLNYEIMYEDMKIGRVVFEFHGTSATVTFHPEKRFKP
jgi:hypothetical protein